MIIKTDNFNPVTDPKLCCTCGNPGCDERSVLQWVLDKAQLMRDDLNMPMHITSGGRCPLHPDEINKAKPADHQLCVGIDFECDCEFLETKIKVLAGRHGATRVAGTWKDGFIHVGWTETNRTDVPTWRYK